MKAKWSSKWTGSKQPRKQRKYRANAPMHIKRKFLSVTLSKELRRRYSRRSIPVRKGDEVRVISGKFKKTTGKVERVDLRKSKVYVDSVKSKKVDGSEIMRALEPSNLMLTKLEISDKMRKKALERKKGVKVQLEPKKEEKTETKTEEKKETTEKPKTVGVEDLTKMTGKIPEESRKKIGKIGMETAKDAASKADTEAKEK